MKKQFSFFALICLLGGLVACNNTESKDSVEKADSANEKKADTSSSGQTSSTLGVDEETSGFMVNVANGGMTEVEVSKVAEGKAKNKRVKDFANMMVRDHSKGNDELKGLASQKNVTLPATIGEDNQKHIDDLKKKSGNDFDKSYMKMMVDDHEKTVDAFEKTSKNTKDADVKSWVDKTLPTLRMHLDSAKSINSALK